MFYHAIGEKLDIVYTLDLYPNSKKSLHIRFRYFCSEKMDGLAGTSGDRQGCYSHFG